MPTDDPPDQFAALFEKTGGAAPRRGGARVGETLWVVVLQVAKDGVFVELDGHLQGFIEGGNLQAPDGTLKVAVGDRLRARVVRVDADTGIELAPTVEAAVAVGASVSVGQTGGGAAAGPEARCRAASIASRVTGSSCSSMGPGAAPAGALFRPRSSEFPAAPISAKPSPPAPR